MFLPGKFHGQRTEEPGGLTVGVIRVGHDLATKPQWVIDNRWEIYRKGQKTQGIWWRHLRYVIEAEE